MRPEWLEQLEHPFVRAPLLPGQMPCRIMLQVEVTDRYGVGVAVTDGNGLRRCPLPDSGNLLELGSGDTARLRCETIDPFGISR